MCARALCVHKQDTFQFRKFILVRYLGGKLLISIGTAFLCTETRSKE